MKAADWISLLATLLSVLTVSAGAIVKLTRLVDAVEHLAETLQGMGTKIAEHERRLGDVERATDPTRRYRPW